MSAAINVISHNAIVTRNKIDSYRASGTGFSDLFRTKISGLTFSAHAEARMKSRQISLSPERMLKLEGAVERAKLKGSRDSLVLLSNLAFIVNIPNRTVVTAMDGDSLRENVFTNIDSTVIVTE
jgi:flagellar operon protein